MPIVACNICQNKFYVKPSHQKMGYGKYCSKNCQSKAQLAGKHVPCFLCGKKIYRSLSQIKHSKSGNFFCDKTCQTRWKNSFKIEASHPNWRNGTSAYRNILLRSDRIQVCEDCGINDVRILTAHHIDLNRKNNNLSNLMWLCLNCHYLRHLNIKSLQKNSKLP